VSGTAVRGAAPARLARMYLAAGVLPRRNLRASAALQRLHSAAEGRHGRSVETDAVSVSVRGEDCQVRTVLSVQELLINIIQCMQTIRLLELMGSSRTQVLYNGVLNVYQDGSKMTTNLHSI